MYIPVMNLGGQYNHLICRMLDELDVDTEFVTPALTVRHLEERDARGLILGGSPRSMPEDLDKLGNLPHLIGEVRIPVLGICLGHQFLSVSFGGVVRIAEHPEFGPVKVYVNVRDEIFDGVGGSFVAWLSHNDEVARLPVELEVLAHSKNCRVEALRHRTLPIYGVQFHPEVVHTERGRLIFENFLRICRGHSS